MPLSVQDHLDIQQLYARYNHAIDSGKADAWAACLTAEGVFESSGGTFSGREALAQFAKGYAERLKGRHWTNNLVLDGDGASATGSCYLMLYRLGGDAPASILTTGIYQDELVREGDGRRFKARKVLPDA